MATEQQLHGEVVERADASGDGQPAVAEVGVEQVDRSVAAATTPATRLILALAAVHAARVAQIAALMLDEDWLEHRRNRWPNTANLHLLINNQTANTTGRASNHWISAPMRGQDATLERLRVDRQLEEAMVKGPDAPHLAEVFGLDEKTAIRYASSTRALMERPLETDPATSPRTH
ncbi:hypothetical protein [Streptomyces canus]|uniref:hypothetical protein n=1 Tax=Streptomyces canus TaxID=58343 RepID=UPI003CF46A74